ncbi:PLP-dependent aminotransferase family protein [Deinococcus peraridilitoris]|uniref:Transcriptional regulator with HTH domain and aminotransferase domain protein n=1 Tax=Deinococcus peraridilitoris (strain DSM 19664 / LMG 22246 / CIP 109416 / KR-200) TaxID=937777 RepID=L0A4V7_DEIPD|nr:PLP-dependent aminotransferase family protein [Deinococcus peraridilitoris]AFZ68202.1 transcriptional regulator with HTH domain and aminotransferase domain protein [Deinococcus peraridilitoris DSM 19664]
MPEPLANTLPGSRAELPVLLQLERGTEALHRQIARQLRAAILDGRLARSAPLPSTRALSRELGVARGAVVEAYAELHAEGYLESRHGSGTRVMAASPPTGPRGTRASVPGETSRWLRGEPDPVAADGPPSAPGIHFRLGQPSVRELDQDAWRRAWRDMLQGVPPCDYGDARGEVELRSTLAGFLTRSRGLPTAPDDLIVTTGAAQGLNLLARAVLREGDRVAFEEPGYRFARQVLGLHGAGVMPVNVDDDGLRVEELPEGHGAPLMLYCTPSHQYPLGSRLPVARRLALLAWAERNDVLIVEDDYDSEFRYGAPPLPTLASLDRTRVVYMGTLSKVLMPAVRLGYLVAPPALSARVIREKTLADRHDPWPLQRALAAFIAQGSLERHVRRMRRVYAAKREVLTQELRPLEPTARLTGIEAGLHACLELQSPLSARTVAAACAARGVHLSPLDSYYLGPVQREALLLGYGALSLTEIKEGVAVLREVLNESAGVKGPG